MARTAAASGLRIEYGPHRPRDRELEVLGKWQWIVIAEFGRASIQHALKLSLIGGGIDVRHDLDQVSLEFRQSIVLGRKLVVLVLAVTGRQARVDLIEALARARDQPSRGGVRGKALRVPMGLCSPEGSARAAQLMQHRAHPIVRCR